MWWGTDVAEDLMESRSRLVGTAAFVGLAALAGLSAAVGLACQGHPLTVAAGRKPDAATPPPADGGSMTSVDAEPHADAATPPPTDGGTTNADTGPHADGMTLGCGMDPNQPLGTYTQYHLSVAGPDLDANMQPKVRDRIYWARLPSNYDQTVPYRVVYLAPGCGGNSYTEVFSLQKASGDNAILVAIMPLPDVPYNGCFDETINSIEYPFFDALHKKIENQFCVDTDRQFYAGFSTGARLGIMLDCAFPDVLRATATDQGALPPLPPCKNRPIAGFFLADTLETGNPYLSNVLAANRLAMQNGCTGTFQNATPFDPMAMVPAYPTTSCVTYTGCPADYPIVFCTTMGWGKVGCDLWCDEAFWSFFKQF
jgi:poly(3-hydroxybutyrate) depolymerase